MTAERSIARVDLSGTAVNSASNANYSAAVPLTSKPDAGPMDSHAAPGTSLKLDE